MKVFVGFLVVVIFIFVIISMVIGIAWRAIRLLLESLDTFLNGKTSRLRRRFTSTEKPEIPVIIPERSHTEEEKAHMAALAISESIAESRYQPESYEQGLAEFSQVLKEIKDNEIKAELMEALRVFTVLRTIFIRDKDHYKYTREILASALSGVCTALTGPKEHDEDYASGIMYAAKYIQDYILRISVLAGVARQSGESGLKEGVSEMVDKLERFYWLEIAYPKNLSKNEAVVQEMISSLTHKLQMYVNVRSYGVNSSEADTLLKTAVLTVKEMNVALENTLQGALSWDLMQADVTLEALRREMRLRGLY